MAADSKATAQPRWRFLAAVGLLFLAHLVLLYLTVNRHLDFLFNDAAHRLGPGTDFGAFYNAGVSCARDGNIYGHGPGFGFRYHPLFALGFLSHLAQFPGMTAFRIWIFLNEAALVAAFVHLWKLKPSRSFFLKAAGFTVIFSPLYLELFMGNASLMAAALLFMAFYYLHREKTVPFLVLFIVALLVKPIGLVFFPWLLIRRKFVPVAVAGLVFVGSAVPYFASHPADFQLFWNINTSGISQPGWVVHGGQMGFHGLMTDLCTRLNGISTLELGAYSQLPAFCQIILYALPLVLVGLGIFISFQCKNSFGICIFSWIAVYILGYQDVWEHSYSFVLLGLANLYVEKALSRRLFLVCAMILALPTLFLFYDPEVITNGTIDPEHDWNLGISLLHHSVKPLAMLVLFGACFRIAFRNWKKVRS